MPHAANRAADESRRAVSRSSWRRFLPIIVLQEKATTTLQLSRPEASCIPYGVICTTPSQEQVIILTHRICDLFCFSLSPVALGDHGAGMCTVGQSQPSLFRRSSTSAFVSDVIDGPYETIDVSECQCPHDLILLLSRF